MKIFTAMICVVVASMFAVVIFGTAKLNKNTEICKSIKGIMVVTPDGNHCLTKKDFE